MQSKVSDLAVYSVTEKKGIALGSKIWKSTFKKGKKLIIINMFQSMFKLFVAFVIKSKALFQVVFYLQAKMKL